MVDQISQPLLTAVLLPIGLMTSLAMVKLLSLVRHGLGSGRPLPIVVQCPGSS
jgi:hypothetical protein